MKNKIILSIIIINFNTFELTKKSIDAVLAATSHIGNWEIILIDNASSDDSADKLKNYIETQNISKLVKLYILQKNIGFSGGNNIGIKKSQGEIILLLNSDTEVQQNAIYECILLLKNEDVGAIGCKLILANGKIDPACHRGFPTPWASLTYMLGLEKIWPKSKLFGQYHLGYLNNNSVHEVDAISGAFFMTKRKVLESVGFLDEDYFMYGEDLDLAYRIKKAGWKIIFTPKVNVLHFKKRSGLNNADLAVQRQIKYHFYKSMLIFYLKHYKKAYPPFVTQITTLVLKIRMALI